MKKTAGFTLIELMIVVAVIGILASIALPSYQTYVKKAHTLEGITLASMAKSAIWDYWSANGEFPVDNDAAGFPSNVVGNSVSSVSISRNKITITYNQRVLQGSTIIIAASESSSGSLTWDCKNGTLGDIYKPISCR